MTLALLLFAPLILLTIVALPLIGRLILGPINRAAGYLRAPTRFQLSDFAWLMLQLQVVLAICVQFVGFESRGAFPALMTFGTLAVAVMWAAAVSFLSRAGIVDPWRRACFTLVVLPGTLVVLMLTPYLFGGSCVVAFQYLRQIAHGYEDFSSLRVLLGITVGILALLAMLAIGWCLRRLSLWIAAGTEVFVAEVVHEAAHSRDAAPRQQL